MRIYILLLAWISLMSLLIILMSWSAGTINSRLL